MVSEGLSTPGRRRPRVLWERRRCLIDCSPVSKVPNGDVSSSSLGATERKLEALFACRSTSKLCRREQRGPAALSIYFARVVKKEVGYWTSFYGARSRATNCSCRKCKIGEMKAALQSTKQCRSGFRRAERRAECASEIGECAHVKVCECAQVVGVVGEVVHNDLALGASQRA